MWFSFFITWEQCKLGDIAIEVNRTDANSNAPIMMITANDGFIEQSERYAFNNAGESLKRYIVLQKGELAYNHGASKLRPYGSCFALINQEKARIPFVYHCFSVENHNSEFVSIELNGNDVESQLRRIVSSGARMDGLLNISFQDYASISILLPEKAEQDKIARVFRNLDNLITLHQRKQNDLFFLILSKKLSLILANDWEQRKVQDVADRYDNLRIPVAANLRESGNIPYYGANGIQDYVNGFTHEGEFVLVAEDGANDLKNYPVQHVQGRIWVNNHAHVLQGKPALMNNLFLAYSLHRADIASFLVGGSRAKLNADTLMTLELLLPSVEEQTKIGRNLAAVDNLITLHQCKRAAFFDWKRWLYSKFEESKITLAWEQRKLGEFGNFTSNGVDKLSKPNEIPVSLLNYMDVYNRRHITAKTCMDLMQVTARPVQIRNNDVRAGDVYFTPTSETAEDIGHSLVIEENLPNTVYSYHLMRYRPRSGVFFKTYPNFGFDTKYLHDQMAVKAKGVQRFVISKPDFEDLQIICPSYYEQESIARFLTLLDNLITLHQRGEKINNRRQT